MRLLAPKDRLNSSIASRLLSLVGKDVDVDGACLWPGVEHGVRLAQDQDAGEAGSRRMRKLLHNRRAGPPSAAQNLDVISAGVRSASTPAQIGRCSAGGAWTSSAHTLSEAARQDCRN